MNIEIRLVVAKCWGDRKKSYNEFGVIFNVCVISLEVMKCYKISCNVCTTANIAKSLNYLLLKGKFCDMLIISIKLLF
jgi:hypothetical protein